MCILHLHEQNHGFISISFCFYWELMSNSRIERLHQIPATILFISFLIIMCVSDTFVSLIKCRRFTALKGGKIHLGSGVQRLQSVTKTLTASFGLMARQGILGRECVVEHSCLPHSSSEAESSKDGFPASPSGHTPVAFLKMPPANHTTGQRPSQEFRDSLDSSSKSMYLLKVRTQTHQRLLSSLQISRSCVIISNDQISSQFANFHESELVLKTGSPTSQTIGL